MQNRETKNCNKCGTLGEIVPAGTSKKTGKPYGAFMKCKSCGNSEQIGIQPPKQTGVSKDFIYEILKTIEAKQDEILKILKAPKVHKINTDEGGEFPF